MLNHDDGVNIRIMPYANFFEMAQKAAGLLGYRFCNLADHCASSRKTTYH
jgi:hypothetical protein